MTWKNRAVQHRCQQLLVYKIVATPNTPKKGVSHTIDTNWKLRDVPRKDRICVHGNMLPEDLVGTLQITSISNRKFDLPLDKIHAFIKRLQATPPLHISGLETSPELQQFFSTLFQDPPHLVIFGETFKVPNPTARLYCQKEASQLETSYKPPTSDMLDVALCQNDCPLPPPLKPHLIDTIERLRRLMPLCFLTVQTVVRQIKAEMAFDRAKSPQPFHVAKALSSLYPKRLRNEPVQYAQLKHDIWTRFYPDKIVVPGSHPYLLDMIMSGLHRGESPLQDQGYHAPIQQFMLSLTSGDITVNTQQLKSMGILDGNPLETAIRKYVQDPVANIELGLQAKESRKIVRNKLKLAVHGLATTLGPTGIGKTHMAYKMEDVQPTYFCVGPCSGYGQLISTQEIDTENDRLKLTKGALLDYIHACQEAERQGMPSPLFIADEATLLPEWSLLVSVIEAGGLWVDGTFHGLLNPRFYVLGNEGYVGRNNLTDLMSFPIQRWLTYSRDFIFHRMIKPAIDPETSPQLTALIAETLANCSDLIHQTVNYESFGPRELQDIAAEVSLLRLSNPAHIQAQVIFLCLKSLSSVIRRPDFQKIAQALLSEQNCTPNAKQVIEELLEIMPQDVTASEERRLQLLEANRDNPFLKRGIILAQRATASGPGLGGSCAEPGFYDTLEEQLREANASGPLTLLNCHLIESHLWEGKVNGPLSSPEYTGIVSFHCRHTRWVSPALQSRCCVISLEGTNLLKSVLTKAPRPQLRSPNIIPRAPRQALPAPQDDRKLTNTLSPVRLTTGGTYSYMPSPISAVLTKPLRYGRHLWQAIRGQSTDLEESLTQTDTHTTPRNIPPQPPLFKSLTPKSFDPSLTILTAKKVGTIDPTDCRPIRRYPDVQPNFEFTPNFDTHLAINCWYELPAMSPAQVFTDFPPNTTVIQDPQSGLFLFQISTLSPPVPTFKIAYTPLPSALDIPLGGTCLTNNPPPTIPEDLIPTIQDILHQLGITRDTPSLEAVGRIELYLKNFTQVPLVIQQGASEVEKITALLRQRKGVCRHRMDCAEYLLSFLNIPYSRINNKSHTYIIIPTSTGDWVSLDPRNENRSLYGPILEEDHRVPVTPTVTHPKLIDRHGKLAPLVFSVVAQQTGSRGRINPLFLRGSDDSPLSDNGISFKRKKIVFSRLPPQELLDWCQTYGFAVDIQQKPSTESPEILYIQLEEDSETFYLPKLRDPQDLVRQVQKEQNIYHLTQALQSIYVYPKTKQKEIFNQLSRWIIETRKTEPHRHTRDCLMAFLNIPRNAHFFLEAANEQGLISDNSDVLIQIFARSSDYNITIQNLSEHPQLLLEFLSTKDSDGNPTFSFLHYESIIKALSPHPQLLLEFLSLKDGLGVPIGGDLTMGIYYEPIIKTLSNHPQLLLEFLYLKDRLGIPNHMQLSFMTHYKLVIEALSDHPTTLLEILSAKDSFEDPICFFQFIRPHYKAIIDAFLPHPKLLLAFLSLKDGIGNSISHCGEIPALHNDITGALLAHPQLLLEFLSITNRDGDPLCCYRTIADHHETITKALSPAPKLLESYLSMAGQKPKKRRL